MLTHKNEDECELPLEIECPSSLAAGCDVLQHRYYTHTRHSSHFLPVGSGGFSPHSSGMPLAGAGGGAAELGAKLGIVFRVRRDAVFFCSADSQAWNGTWKSFAEILGHPGREAGWFLCPGKGDGWTSKAAITRKRCQGRVHVQNKSRQSSGNWPCFMLNVLLTVWPGEATSLLWAPCFHL